jgi:hypothetical protein
MPLHDSRHRLDFPTGVSILAVTADAVGRALNAGAVALAVLFLTSRALAAASANDLFATARRCHLLVLDFEVRSLEGVCIVHANAPDGVDSFLLVLAVVVAVLADTLRRAPHIVAEALAVLLQALRPTASAPGSLSLVIVVLLVGIVVDFWGRVEAAGLVDDPPLPSRREGWSEQPVQLARQRRAQD